ncbi:MAG TPA: hypothetical protein VN750_08225, partial [Steroidobacteraceae bacterium]|nr:hypothetical protein [Steroidobacteraceae bacterium]
MGAELRKFLQFSLLQEIALVATSDASRGATSGQATRERTNMEMFEGAERSTDPCRTTDIDACCNAE